MPSAPNDDSATLSSSLLGFLAQQAAAAANPLPIAPTTATLHLCTHRGHVGGSHCLNLGALRCIKPLHSCGSVMGKVACVWGLIHV